MANPDLGTKRTCTSCGARFYDLGKMPVECPKCEAKFIPEVLLPSKETAAEPKPAEPVMEEKKKKEEDDVEVVSLEEVDEPDGDDSDEDDEMAAIADVDLGDDDDDDDDSGDDDDAFLEDDDESDSDVSGLIGGVSGDEEET